VVRSRLRTFLALLLLLITGSLRWLGEAPLGRALLPLAALYAAYSAGVIVARRVARKPLRLFYTTPLVDIPFAGVVGFIWARVPGQSPDWACGATVAGFVFAVGSLAVMLHARVLATAMATSAAATIALFWLSHQPLSRLAFSLLLIGLTGAAGSSVIRYAVTFVRRSQELADARVRDVQERSREVQALNEELRRQVAERSRELTEALARSEGSVAPAALAAGDVFDER
jgi:hypothetical protein